MSLNASSASNYIPEYYCSISKATIIISTCTNALRLILLLPLCTFILYLGQQQWWRQQHSFKTASHSDIFTYHLVTMELIWVLGCFLYFVGLYLIHSVILTVGMFFCNITLFGEISFHVLTCGERYLAVVHPITYRGLRNTRGKRIRNISIGCVWLLCFILTSAYYFLSFKYSAIALFCVFTFDIIILCFCSVSVLCALIGPGPGEGGGEKERVDQTKRRAFQSITAISCVVWMWFVGLLVSTAVDQSTLVDDDVNCVVGACLYGLNLPSCLVQPLLYLQKAGKLPCYRG